MAGGAARRKRRIWTFIPPTALGLGLMMAAVSNPPAPAQDETPPEARVVRVVEAAAIPITPRAVGYGVAEPARTWTVTSDVAGRIVYVSPHFVRGGALREGEIVVRIDDADYQLIAAQSRADILSVDAQIEELRLTEENLRATLELQSQELTVAERELQRQRDLAARGAGSVAAVDASERAALTMRSAVLELENQLRLIPAQIDALTSARAVSEAQLAAAELDIDRVEIRAPFDGRVAAADAEISQYVGIGASLGAVDGVATAEVTALFPTSSMRNFGRIASFETDPAARSAAAWRGAESLEQIGAELGVRAVVAMEVSAGAVFGSGAPTWPGDVLRISDSIDEETRAIGVIVSIDDPYGQNDAAQRSMLLKGAFLRVELYAEPVTGFVVAPRSAVRTGPGGAAEILVVGADERLERREVEVVGAMNEIVAIRSGVEPGERIIITDLAPAIEGASLRAILDEDAAARLRAAAGPPAGAIVADPETPGPGSEAREAADDEAVAQ